jgi:hypothetical protein
LVELVEIEPAQPTVRGHGLRQKAPKAAAIFDDRAERGHDVAGIIVKLDRHSRPHRDVLRTSRERNRGGDRFVGSLLGGMAEHRMVLGH